MLHAWRHRNRCRKLARKCAHAGLAEYIAGCASVNIGRLVDTPIISVDLELTGLDARRNQIIAIGWTVLEGGRIQFSSNRHILIKGQQSVGNSAVIHQLTDNDLAQGVILEAGLEELFAAARNRLWLFHHAALDAVFLQNACLRWAGLSPPFIVLDTLQIELALRKRRDEPLLQGNLQLGRLRANYNLPRYASHDALIDAEATAELLLAQAARLDSSNSLRLKPYVKYF